MAAIELLCRYAKDPKSAIFTRIEKALDVEALIQGDKFDRDKEREKLIGKRTDVYEYGPMVVKLQDMATFNLVDEQHTLVSFYTGKSYVFKIHHLVLKQAYQTLLSTIIHDFTNPDISKPPEQDE